MNSLIFNKPIYLYALFSLMLMMPQTLLAQNNGFGSIKVKTIDKKINRNLSEVTIVITDRDNNSQTFYSNEEGESTITQLEPGLYSISAVKDGFAIVIESSVRVIANNISSTTIYLPTVGPGAVDQENMDLITVLGVRNSKVVDGPVSTSYMDREMLRSSVGGGSDVMRALDGMPGLTSTGEFASFNVRGRGPRDNLIYVDNMPFDKIVHFDSSIGESEDIDGGGRFSIFAPNVIESAEFSPGGWSAAYGGKAGSLLKLDVIDGSETPTASLRLDLAGYEVGYEGPNGLGQSTRMVFNARRLDFGQFFETIEELDIGEPILSDVLFKSVTNLNNSNSLEFLFLHSPEEYTRDLIHVVESPNFEDVEVGFNEQDSSLFGVTWNSFIGNDSELTSNFYYRVSDKFSSQGEAFPDLVPTGTPFNEIPVRRDILTLAEDEKEIGLRLDYNRFNSFGVFKSGLEIRRFDLDFNTVLNEEWIQYIYDQNDFRPSSTQNFIVLQPEFINSSYDLRATSYAAYIDQAFEYENWKFNTGLRYQYDYLSNENLISPRLNASWTPSATSQYSAAAGIFYQAPSFIDRASSPVNATLENEKITHLSFGGNWRLSASYNFLTEIYFQKLDNLIVDSNRTDGILSNSGDGDSYGLDAVFTRYFANNWSAIATYSYNNSKRDDNDGNGEYDADNNREHVFTLGSQWEINQNWKVGARWKYLSGTPTDDFIIHENVLGNGNPLRFSQEFISNNTLRNGDFNLLNIRVDYYKRLGRFNLIAFLDVTNVLSASTNGEEEFNPLTGALMKDEEEVQPMIGLKFETTF